MSELFKPTKDHTSSEDDYLETDKPKRKPDKPPLSLEELRRNLIGTMQRGYDSYPDAVKTQLQAKSGSNSSVKDKKRKTRIHPALVAVVCATGFLVGQQISNILDKRRKSVLS